MYRRFIPTTSISTSISASTIAVASRNKSDSSAASSFFSFSDKSAAKSETKKGGGFFSNLFPKKEDHYTFTSADSNSPSPFPFTQPDNHHQHSASSASDVRHHSKHGDGLFYHGNAAAHARPRNYDKKGNLLVHLGEGQSPRELGSNYANVSPNVDVNLGDMGIPAKAGGASSPIPSHEWWNTQSSDVANASTVLGSRLSGRSTGVESYGGWTVPSHADSGKNGVWAFPRSIRD